MRYVQMLKNNSGENSPVPIQESVTHQELIKEKEEKPEDILRKADFKIKLTTPTAFGTQIDFAKLYDEEDIKEILKDFSIKIKGKSVFIIK